MDFRRLVLLLISLSLAACSSQKHKPVNEELYFKNYALAVCLGSSFDDAELNKDINKAINGYIERGGMALEVYEEIGMFVNSWSNKNYQSKDGSQVNSAKCIDLYNSEELQDFYKRNTPCSSPKDWYDPKKYLANCK